MSDIAQLHCMNIGEGFHVYFLRVGERAESTNPFLGDHAWPGTRVFQPQPLRSIQ